MQQNRSERTRREIMNAAVAMFCQSGYDAASVAEICERAGVSKGAFYHHFPSKQSLFLAILEDWLVGIDAQLAQARQADEPVPHSIRRMADTIGAVFQVASGQLPMFMEFMLQASRDPVVWQATIAPYRRYQQRFTDLIAEGQREGSLRSAIQPQTAAWVLISLAVGILLQGVVDPQAADWHHITRQGIDMLLANMQEEQNK